MSTEKTRETELNILTVKKKENFQNKRMAVNIFLFYLSRLTKVI